MGVRFPFRSAVVPLAFYFLRFGHVFLCMLWCIVSFRLGCRHVVGCMLGCRLWGLGEYCVCGLSSVADEICLC